MSDPESALTPRAARNSNRTVRWQPRAEVEVRSAHDAAALVRRTAAARGRIVAVTPARWSWTTSVAVDGAVAVRVADASVAVADGVCVAGAGAPVSAVYDAARRAGLQLDAHGMCMVWSLCQTVGGVLATNVHHAGTPTYGSRCLWLEVVDGTGRLRRTTPGTQLFRLTVGGSGRTGLIVRAAFRLTPRTYYRSVPVLSTLRLRRSTAAELEAYVAAYRGAAPLALISSRSLLPYALTARVERVRVDGPGRDQRSSRAGEAPWAYRLLVRPLDRLLQELPYEAYQLWTCALLPFLSTVLTTFPARGPVHLDIACSADYVTWGLHQEVEFYVPVARVREFGEWWDAHARGTRYLRRALLAFRYVHGEDLAFAGNAPARDDYVCFNLDSYHVPTFAGYTREIEAAAEAIRARFDGAVRAHPGKVNVPSGTYAAEDVKAVRRYDPHGVFAPAPYRHAAYTFRHTPPVCVGVTLLVALAGGVWAAATLG
jgi:FAD/FMN-containing dehydrogenase